MKKHHSKKSPKKPNTVKKMEKRYADQKQRERSRLRALGPLRRNKPRESRVLSYQQDVQYTWQGFQKEDFGREIHLDSMYVSPPKPIQIVRLDEPVTVGGGSSNFCASWLAKNGGRKKKMEEVLVDESFREVSKDEDVIVLDEMPVDVKKRDIVKKKDFRDTLMRRADSAEDSIIFVAEIPKKTEKASKMTQLEKKIETTFWTSPNATSSTTTTSTTVTVLPTDHLNTATSSSPSPLNELITCPLMKILDGYSKDCTAAKREIRRWSKLGFQIIRNPQIVSTTFKICSYNVLCQKTIERTNYLYRHLKSQPHYLEWTHRWKGLQEELPTFDADILGLQEVQCDHFFDYFEPCMKKYGYEGIYKQKHGTAQKDDGCALFYRPEKFDRIGYEEVNYFISPEAISNRENIAQILALRCKVTDEILLIANTHLLFNEERGDVKLAQLAILFSRIHKMQKSLSTKFRTSTFPPVMVMGDFNMEPNSQIYRFVVEGGLHVEGQFIRTMSGQSGRAGGKVCRAAEILFETTFGADADFGASKELPELDGTIRHPFKFVSAYHHTPKPVVILENEQGISTYHKDTAAPDFIFYSTEKTKKGVEKLQLLERFELPTRKVLAGVMPWPNRHVPSDHLPIMAKFELTKDN